MTLLDHSRAQERAAKTRPTTNSDTVVGSMAADGGHENTREGSPVEKQRLGSYRSAVSLRLQRMYRATTSDETLEAAEDKFDEAAEMVVANTPSEIWQLSSCTLRMIFRVVLYGSYLVAVAFFFSTVYKAKLRATYLAADRNKYDMSVTPPVAHFEMWPYVASAALASESHAATAVRILLLVITQTPCRTPHDVDAHGVLVNALLRLTPSSTHQPRSWSKSEAQLNM